MVRENKRSQERAGGQEWAQPCGGSADATRLLSLAWAPRGSGTGTALPRSPGPTGSSACGRAALFFLLSHGKGMTAPSVSPTTRFGVKHLCAEPMPQPGDAYGGQGDESSLLQEGLPAQASSLLNGAGKRKAWTR